MKIIAFCIFLSSLAAIFMLTNRFDSISLKEHQQIFIVHKNVENARYERYEPFNDTNNIKLDFRKLTEWIRNHPNGLKFAMDSSQIDYMSRELHKDVMDTWSDREINIHKLDTTQLEQIENHCFRKWRHLIQNKFKSTDKYIGEYVLKQGNKIGALRHFGFIPWDDDFDILFYIKDAKYQQTIFELFEDIPSHPKYGKCSMVYRKCGFGKIYFNNLELTLDVQGFGNMNPNVWNTEYSHLSTNEIRYPLIDIFFGYLSEDSQEVLYTLCGDITDSVPKCATTKFEDTFPVQYLPVNDRYYPFEKDVLWSMSESMGEYGEDDPVRICVIEIMGLYSHRKDTEWAYSDPVECKLFWNDFTFVRIDQYVSEGNIDQFPWIQMENIDGRLWAKQLKFINIKISFYENNTFHRAYMMAMFENHTFETVNITSDILKHL